MSKLSTLQPLDENGQPLADAVGFLDESTVIEVLVTRKDGKQAIFHAEVDHTRVGMTALKKYQREVNRIADEADKKSEELAKAINAERAKRSAANAAAKKKNQPLPFPDEEEITNAELEAEAQGVDLMEAYAQLEAELLHPLVIATNIPHVVVTETGMSPDLLTARTGVGPALRNALRAYFFPSSKPQAAVTGSSEEVSTTSTSSTSEPTPGAENIPATS
jgi:hypothetical protein